MSGRVYLAGAITGLTLGEAEDWRAEASKQLARFGIVGLSPLRGKDYLVMYGELTPEGYANHPLSRAKGITTRDRFDCQRADIVLVNLLGATRVSIGTMMELGWADAARRPIVIAMEPGNLHDHAMVHEVAGYVVDTLQDAIDVCVATLKED